MSCDNVVETTTEAFSLTFEESELAAVRDALTALTRPIEGGAVIWLVDRGEGTRLWLFEDAGTVAWLRTSCARGAAVTVPIEPVLLMEMGSLASVHDTVSLRLVPEDRTLLASAGEVHVCVDHLADLGLDEDTLAAINESEPTEVIARLPLEPLAAAMSILRVHGAAFEGGPPPFVGMKVAGGEIRFTVDWRRFGGGRYTGAVAASHEGEASASFFGHQVVRYLTSRNWDPENSESEVTVSVVDHGGIDTRVVRFATESWGVAAWADRESAVRWCSKVEEVLTAAGCDVDGHPRHVNSIDFRRHGIEMTARIEPGDTPDDDRVRVLVQMGAGIADNLEVHREINAFNGRWSDVKLVLVAPNLYGCIDVPCGHLERLGPAVETLASRHIDLAPMLNVYA
jgi:hypothetical protein